MKNSLYKTDHGEMFEAITFTSGITDYYYSTTLHRVNSICNTNGWDMHNWMQFKQALTLI